MSPAKNPRAKSKAGIRPPEQPKRLQPTQEVLRQLFLKCGNFCAFPDCNSLMMTHDGDFVGQVCHIQAAEPGGERFNSTMTNEQRRSFENLMLMCYPHHTVTNDVAIYTVAKLQEMKARHEQKFSDPGRAMIAQLRDWTTVDTPSHATNLRKANRVLKWDVDEDKLAKDVISVRKFVDDLRRVPVASRKIAGLLAVRAWDRKRSLKPLQRDYFELLADDAQEALQLSRSQFAKHIGILQSHGMADFGEDNEGKTTVRLSGISYWQVWDDLAEFCLLEKMPIDSFAIELRFQQLDE